MGWYGGISDSERGRGLLICECCDTGEAGYEDELSNGRTAVRETKSC